MASNHCFNETLFDYFAAVRGRVAAGIKRFKLHVTRAFTHRYAADPIPLEYQPDYNESRDGLKALGAKQHHNINLARAEITLTENLDSISTAVLALSAVMGSRYVAALPAATAQQITNAAAAYRVAAAAGARGVIALIDDSAGAATLPAATIFYFYQKAQQVRQEANI
ncbi:hypothetical protein PWF83_19025 [Pantoea dispersa]|uniref:hypothetical protein n=1 Tax=Pantoea dispersa TaxID=59814 RepID=UPI0023A98BE7|nr:hypothetical protein [Pantoea dispersa]WEA05756.1 hypothetical protein PWF83_19025 [Pantoea dispersa]